jgi:ribosomal-protein-alanine N-acetyltransferase
MRTIVVPDDFRLPAGRVTLRKLTTEDAPAIYQIFSNPQVMRYWSRPPMADPAEADKLLSEVLSDYESGASLPLGIERNDESLLIGNCTLFHFNAVSRRAEVGYALGRPWWGMGYMHEALRTLLNYAFDDLGLNRLEADIDPRNLASARSLARLGFRKEGHLRQRWIVNDEVSDTDLYGLLRADWLNAE